MRPSTVLAPMPPGFTLADRFLPAGLACRLGERAHDVLLLVQPKAQIASFV